MEFELKDYDATMRDVFKSLCDEEIIEYINSEPLRRFIIKTKEKEYYIRLWNMKQINDQKVWIDAELFDY
jgi:hypothetical protein